MALNYCQGCTTAFALSLDACPHCRQPTATTVTEVATEVQPEPRRAKQKPTAEPEPEPGDDRG